MQFIDSVIHIQVVLLPMFRQVLVLSKQFISSYLERTSQQPEPPEVESSSDVMPLATGA